MSFVDWFMASFLYCFPYSYCSSNYCDSNSCRFFTLLKALAKSNSNLFAIAYKSEKERQVIFSLSPIRARKSNNFKERAIKKSKELIPKRMLRGLRVITLQGAIEKSPILLSHYWKNEWLNGTIIISYFGGSNNISPTVHIYYLYMKLWIYLSTIIGWKGS